MQKSTVDETEISHFAQDSAQWWYEAGPFKPLHRLTPVRLAYIREQICGHYGLDMKSLKPFKGLSVLDIGCGGGLACEPMAKMDATVTGIDADATAINVARTHSQSSNLDINYMCGDAAGLKTKYDVVLALEVIEHASNPSAFVEVCADRLKPGGLLILSTLNKTAKSYALGIIAAEYILRWVPRGTHDWKKFQKPSQISAYGRRAGLETHDIRGLVLNPLTNAFALSETDIDVNYLITLTSRA